MNKKQLIAFADHIRYVNKISPSVDKFTDSHIESLAIFCKSQNPAFKRERWISYTKGKCGPNGGKL